MLYKAKQDIKSLYIVLHQ